MNDKSGHPLKLVGRLRERALLDDVFESVRDESRPAVVWLYGPPGCGKTALAESFITRIAAEAEVFHGVFDNASSTGRDLGRMLAEYFGCSRKSWEAAFRCVHDAYQRLGVAEFEARYDVIGLADIIAASVGEDIQRTRCGFESPYVKNAALMRLFRRLSTSRPVALLLDDADASIEALSLVRHLLQEDTDPPALLVVATARCAPADAQDSRRERMISEVVRSPRTTCVEIGRLADEYQLELIEQLAALEPDLARRLVRHTRGHPLFCIQLVTDWLEGHRLERRGQRLALRREADDLFAPDLHVVWRRRLERALQALTPAEADAGRRALELAAALGPAVDANEWRAACAQVDVDSPAGLVEALVDHELVEADGEHWRIIHATFHHSIERLARQEGRWERVSLACARALEAMYGSAQSLRIAEHLVEAERIEDALEPLYLACRQLHDAGSYEMLQACLDRRDELLDALDAPAEDRRRCQNTIRRAYLALTSGEADRAQQLAAPVVELAEANAWHDELGWAALVLGRRAVSMGEADEALRFYQRALASFERCDERGGLAHTRASLGYIAFTGGASERARAFYDQAINDFATVGDRVMQARVIQRLGLVSILEKQWQRAMRETQQGLEMAEDAGDRLTEAGCWNSFGEIHRARCQWPQAHDAYEKAARLHLLAQNRNELVARVNMGLVDVASGDFGRARDELVGLVQRLAGAGMRVYVGMVELALACCAAADDDWERYDAHFAGASEELSGRDYAFVDEAWLAERAADALVDSDQTERAEQCLKLAIQRYRGLSRHADAHRVESRLDELGHH